MKTNDRMKTVEIMFIACKPITSVEGVANFFAALSKNLIWHPDDAFDNYEYAPGKKTFHQHEVTVLKRAMDTSFEICEQFDADIYGLALESRLENDRQTEFQERMRGTKQRLDDALRRVAAARQSGNWTALITDNAIVAECAAILQSESEKKGKA